MEASSRQHTRRASALKRVASKPTDSTREVDCRSGEPADVARRGHHIWHIYSSRHRIDRRRFRHASDQPTHPELLDGSLASSSAPLERKQLIRTIVLSSAYRQRSAHREELHDRDPLNTLVAGKVGGASRPRLCATCFSRRAGCSTARWRADDLSHDSGFRA